jgi:hypothetical protein
MAPRSVTRVARPPDTMHQGRLENEGCPLLPDEDQDQCSNDHGHGTSRKVKSLRDPSVRLTPISLFLLYDFAVSPSRVFPPLGLPRFSHSGEAILLSR